MNGNGPTSAADPWTALGDIAGTIAPAIMGAQIGQGEGGGGAAMGALDAVGRTVDRRREMAKEDADTKYRQALMQEADSRSQELEIRLKELRDAAANKEEFAASITDPKERSRFKIDPEAYIKREALISAVPGMTSIISQASKGKIAPETLSGLPPEYLSKLYEKAAESIMRGGDLRIEQLEVPGGGKANVMIDFEGKPHLIPSRQSKETMSKEMVSALGRIGYKPESLVGMDDAEYGQVMRDASENLADFRRRTSHESAAGSAEGALEVGKVLGDSAVQDIGTFGNVGRLFEEVKGLAGGQTRLGVAGEAAKQAGGITGAIAQYVLPSSKSAEQMGVKLASIKNAIIKAVTGAQVRKDEEQRIINSLPEFSEYATDPGRFMNKLDTAIRDTRLALKERLDSYKASGKRVPPELYKVVETADEQAQGSPATQGNPLEADTEALRGRFVAPPQAEAGGGWKYLGPAGQ